MEVPADKYLLQDYRTDMRTPSAPQWVDTDNAVVPVRVIGTGFPKPNSKQTVYAYTYYQAPGAAGRQVQVATPTASQNVYFIGAVFYGYDTGAGRQLACYDATTGASGLMADLTNVFGWYNIASGAAAGFQQWWPPFPVKCINGLRAQLDTATAVTSYQLLTVYFMVELV